MLELDIPGFGPVRLQHLVSDYNGTLAVDGRLWPGVRERLTEAAASLCVHMVTADTFGRARSELEGVPCSLHILQGTDEDVQKEDYVRGLGAETVIALGNGRNDRKLLRAARIGIAVCLKEGCSVETLSAADLVVTSPLDALALVLHGERLKATLRC